MVKSIEELTFCDDAVFGKVMEDDELCREVLEVLLQRPVGLLSKVETEKSYRFISDGKPIRMDVYSQGDGCVYDAEMQNRNHRSNEGLQLPHRSRYYQTMIDFDFLDAGGQYGELPEANVIFLCTFDPFGKNHYMYRFCNWCDDLQMELGDKTYKYFFNCSYKGEDIPEGLKTLYHYIQTGEIEGALTQKIQKRVHQVKMNAEWRSEYMKTRVCLMDARNEGRAEGRAEGREEGREEERANTEREKARADAASKRADDAAKRADDAEAEVIRLKKQLELLGAKV